MDFYKRLPLYRGSKLWDNLDSYFQETEQKLQFKARIKRIDDLHVKSKKPNQEDLLDESLLIMDDDGLSSSDEET